MEHIIINKMNKDNIIYRTGDPSQHLYFILKGEVLLVNS